MRAKSTTVPVLPAAKPKHTLVRSPVLTPDGAFAEGQRGKLDILLILDDNSFAELPAGID